MARFRSSGSDDTSEGGMASLIGGSMESAEALASKHDVDIGNVNCPGQIVLSGSKHGIDAVVAEAKEAGFKMAVSLKVAGAYHSRLMQPARDAFEEYIRQLDFQQPTIPVFSNATGEVLTDPEGIKAALVAQITSPVLWSACFSGMQAMGIQGFCGCGPGNVLAGLARRIDRQASVIAKGDWE